MRSASSWQRARRAVMAAMTFIVALVVGIAVPRLARASEASCLADEPLVSALPPEPLCEIVVMIDPTADAEDAVTAAPLCDPSGASVVAPPPVRGIGDDRMEAVPSCSADGFTAWAWLAPDRGDGDPQPSADPPDLATLAGTISPPAAWLAEAPCHTEQLLGPARGFRRAVEHPPAR